MKNAANHSPRHRRHLRGNDAARPGLVVDRVALQALLMTDHRQDYTPTRLYLNGRRMTGEYDVNDAVADYLRLHPEANEGEVRAEVLKAAA